MSVIPQSYDCELCGKQFQTAAEVRDEIAVMNGANSRAWAYICEPCIQKFVDAMDDLFPKNKYAVRRQQAERIAASVRKTVEV